MAIKIISRDNLKPATELGIRRETEILRHLHHKNIVKSYDFIDTDTHFNVVLGTLNYLHDYFYFLERCIRIVRFSHIRSTLYNNPYKNVRCLSHFIFIYQYTFFSERVHGGELFDRIIKKKFYNEKEARDLAVVILKALKHCHDHKIAHRYVRVTFS